jgi:hypothetical protein
VSPVKYELGFYIPEDAILPTSVLEFCLEDGRTDGQTDRQTDRYELC